MQCLSLAWMICASVTLDILYALVWGLVYNFPPFSIYFPSQFFLQPTCIISIRFQLFYYAYAYYELLIISGVLRPRGHELLQDQEGHLDRQRGEYSIYIYIYFYYSYMRDCTYFCQSKGSSWSWLIILYLAERASVCLFFSSKFIHLFTTPLTLIARTPGYSFPWTLDPDSDPDPELYILITS